MKALLVKSPWIDKILEGEKSWEIRSRATKVRGQIGLIRSGSGQIVGTADLADCVGPIPIGEFEQHFDKHQVPLDVMQRFNYSTIYAWVLADAQRLDPPTPYRHPSGAVIWVDLEKLGVRVPDR